MKAAAYDRYGGPEAVRLIEAPRPRPGPGMMLVRVHAASVNSWDWDKLVGNPLTRLEGPFRPRHRVLGADISGVVEETGDGVAAFKPGDEVFGDLTESGWGGFAEFAVASPRTFVRKPAGIGFAAAATLPQAGLLALNGLRMLRTIAPGDEVLVNGAGGGMGSFAILLAKRAGAVVTAVDAGEKAAFMRRLGADRVIHYRQRDFATGPERYDLVLDAVARRSVRAHLGVLKPGGAYVVGGGKTGVLLQTVLFGNRLGRGEAKRSGLLLWRARCPRTWPSSRRWSSAGRSGRPSTGSIRSPKRPGRFVGSAKRRCRARCWSRREPGS